MKRQNIEPELYSDRVIFTSTFNDIVWTARNIEETCASNSEKVKLYTQRFPKGHWTFIGPGTEMKSYGTRDFRPDGKWNSIEAKMVQNFKETMHRVLTSISALNRGILRMIKGKSSIHFNAESTNSELLFRIIFSANQLSVYGAVANWCSQCGLREFEEPGNPSDYEQNINQGLMKSVEENEVHSFGICSETDKGSRKRVQLKCENIRCHALAQSDLHAL